MFYVNDPLNCFEMLLIMGEVGQREVVIKIMHFLTQMSIVRCVCVINYSGNLNFCCVNRYFVFLSRI